MNRSRLAALVVLPFLVLLGLATPAQAHPYLLSASPAVGSTSTTAPQTVLLAFTEGLDRPYSHVTLVAPDGTRIATSVLPGGPSTALTVSPTRSLTQQGTYAVEWTAVGDDGHTVTGAYPLSIGHASANAAVSDSSTGTAGTTSSQGPFDHPLRQVLPLLTVLLAGLLLLSAPGKRLRTGAAVLVLAAVGGLLAQDLSQEGLTAVLKAGAGRRLLLQAALVLLALALPVLLTRLRRRAEIATALGLVVLLAASGHAQSQPGNRRAVVLAVYSVHLTAVSLWIGALVAVVLSGRADRPRLLRLVVGSLATILATGVLLTASALRTLSQLTTTSYGRLVDVKVLLLVLAVVLGAVALRRERFRRPEAGLALGIALLAGVLGQQSLPRDLPLPSQVFAEGTGLPVSVAADGSGLVTGVLTPGVVGRNTLLVRVSRTDSQDFEQPAVGVSAVTATVSCSCSLLPHGVVLHRVTGSPWWTADVDLPVASRWSFATQHVIARETTGAAAVLTATVLRPHLPSQVVVGVAADLSGPLGQRCDDQVLGLQTALADVNSKGSDHGSLVRVVAVDTHAGVGPALARLHELGVTSLAMPCGADSTQVLAAAHRSGLPVVSAGGESSSAFSVGADWTTEGIALGHQAQTQGATTVTAVVGATAADQAELAGLRTAGVPLRVESLAHPAALAAQLGRGVQSVVLLADPNEALPLTLKLSELNRDRHWAPTAGLLASAQLMDTDFINAAGQLTRTGTIEFASDINPFDPSAQYYAQRLRQLTPGVRPTFNGLHGFQAGLLLAQALRDGGGAPSPSALRTRLALGDATVGSSSVHWTSAGGSASTLAFFRSTYVSPMAAAPNTPGAATSLNHEGTFLNAGGFEQISPFRKTT